MSSKFFSLVLGEGQQRVWSKLGMFANDFYMAGGTALALQIGHRKSYDFDFFTGGAVGLEWREKVVKVFGEEIRFSLDTQEQLTWFVSGGVKLTLAVKKQQLLGELVELDGLRLAAVEEIAADKAFVLGRRGVYRDYVDLFFCLQRGMSLEKIMVDAKRKYGAMFEEKLFLEQLVYLDDLSDLVVELVGAEVSVDEVKRGLKGWVKEVVVRNR